MKKAKLSTGEILAFPDETADSVVEETVKRHIAEKLASRAGIGKVMGHDFMQFMGGAFETIIDVAVRRYLSNSKGDIGEVGPQGEQGLIGDKGDKGDRGERGEQGPEGKRGQRGEKGNQGERGFIGERGLKGDRGDKGDKGEGQKGDRGEKGEKGDKGDRGVEGGIGPAGGRGRPGAFWRGTWTSGVAYNDYDAVEYQGSSYVCTASNITTAPPGPHWQVVAMKGTDGSVGSSFDQSLNTTDDVVFNSAIATDVVLASRLRAGTTTDLGDDTFVLQRDQDSNLNGAAFRIDHVWNNPSSGVPKALVVNVTGQAANNTATLLEANFQGSRKFAVDKNGVLISGSVPDERLSKNVAFISQSIAFAVAL